MPGFIRPREMGLLILSDPVKPHDPGLREGNSAHSGRPRTAIKRREARDPNGILFVVNPCGVRRA